MYVCMYKKKLFSFLYSETPFNNSQSLKLQTASVVGSGDADFEQLFLGLNRVHSSMDSSKNSILFKNFLP